MKNTTKLQHPSQIRLAEENHPLVSPIYQTAKFSFSTLEEVDALFKGEREGFLYSRIANPTTRELEVQLADLQGCEDGVSFASGVAAITNVLLSNLRSGDHVLLFLESYRPTRFQVKELLGRFGVTSSIISMDDIPNLQDFIQPETKMILFESPTNPVTRIADIEQICTVAKEHGVLTVLDNTFAGFHNHGQYDIDLYVHSLTKFAGGHSDVFGGVVLGSKKDIPRHHKIAFETGATLDPHAAFLIMRGMKTYTLRYEKQCQNALALAKFLEQHEAIEAVLYPGLPSHPDFELAKKQQVDSGTILACHLKGGQAALYNFIKSSKLFALTGSLGCTESLVAPAKKFYGEDLTEAQCEQAHLFEGTIRLSIGIEDIEDLISDCSTALKLN